MPNHRFNPNSAKSSDNTLNQEHKNTEENINTIEEKVPVMPVNDAASNKVGEQVTEIHSQTSNSYTIISPKPSKIVPQQNTSSVPNPVPNNKDFKLSSTLNEGQTGFRKPGCFQAVPVNIPSVHTAPRKKEATMVIPKNETSSETKSGNPCANAEEGTAQIPMANSNINPIHRVPQSRQTNSPNPTSSETIKHPGYVGGIISNINKSLNTQDCNPPIEPRTTSLSPKPPQHDGNNSKNDYVKSEPPAKVTSKPGYPVKVIPKIGGEQDDRPPELPKKNKPPVAMRNMMTSTESKGAALLQQVSKNFPQEVHKSVPEKNPKTPDKHKSVIAEGSQNKIVWENNKNMKITQHSANNPHSKQKVEDSAFSNDKKGNQVESSKSSDKRFQKVLPPIDTSFHLKPANIKKSSEQQPSEDLKQNPDSSKNEIDQVNTRTFAPPLPVKTSSTIRTDNTGPPSIPPKRSSMVVNLVPNDVAHKTPTDDIGLEKRNVSRKRLEKTKSLSESEQVHYTNEMNKITQLQVDVVQAKEVNNEKNEQLQKGGNMPDLISRIIPDEKNELIILEQNNKVLKSVKSEEDELSKDNFSFNKESEKDGGPDSPKRHSWFFGTHKNSLVVSCSWFN